MIYLPIGIFICLFFLSYSIVYTPLAYFQHIYVLTLTILDSDETMDELSEKLQRIYTIIKWIILGPFFLLFSCISDLIKFYINLFTKPLDADVTLNPHVLSKSTVKLFVDVCKEILVETNKGAVKFSNEVNFIDLNKKFQKRMDVLKNISTLIYKNSDDKFYYDPVSDSQKINQSYLRELKEYAILKALVCNTANKSMVVDINLLLSLVDQVELRYKMFLI